MRPQDLPPPAAAPLRPGMAASNAKKEWMLTDRDLREVERVDLSRWVATHIT